MGEKTINLVYERETKRMVRYYDPTADRPQTHYFPKEWFGPPDTTKFPEEITVTVTW